MSENHIPGLSACVIKEGELIWKGAYGYADIEHHIPVTDSTLFMLASISKTITGTAIMQLYERGLFNLDDNVNKYLPPELQVVNPSYPNDPITFKMILSHASSIKDNWNVLGLLCMPGDPSITLFNFLKNYLIPGGAYFTTNSYHPRAPATIYDYCNVGIALIGYLVEAMTDTSFDDYCQKHIFTPLGMNETSWFLSSLDATHIARPYQWGYLFYPHYGVPYYPASSLRTSSLQLARFLNCFMQKGTLGNIKILDSSTVALMMTPTITPFQGLIWQQENFGNRSVWGHSGGFLGVTTGMYYYEPDKSGVIVLTNGESWDGVSKIIRILFDYAWLYKKIYAHNVSISSTFVRAGIDTLLISSQFNNPENHQFESYAVITSMDKTFFDSIPLLDDGTHGDSHAGDGIWGTRYILPTSIENEFSIGVSTVDLDNGAYFALDDMVRFTTIGPIVLEGYEFVNADTIPNPGEMFGLRLILKNNGKVATAQNVTLKLSCLDLVASVPILAPYYGNIAPGKIAASSTFYPVTIAQGCRGNTKIHFKVDILSDNHVFWSDTFSIHVYPTGITSRNGSEIPGEFSLEQNYPNPFNAQTMIEYQLPAAAHVTLEISNVLGQKIRTLVDEYREMGRFHAAWDGKDSNGKAAPSGLYFYALKTKNYSVSKKMLLIQ